MEAWGACCAASGVSKTGTISQETDGEILKQQAGAGLVAKRELGQRIAFLVNQ